MKLNEIAPAGNYPNFPIFAWFEPSRGPEDIKGVRLAYIEPVKARQAYNIAQATAANDERWLRNVKNNTMASSGQKYFTPDLGWWDNLEAFHSGKGGFGGINSDTLYSKYPDLHIMKSREEAIAAAEQAGII